MNDKPDPVRAALAELVACKDYQDFARGMSLYDYNCREPKAWEAARLALTTGSAAPDPAMFDAFDEPRTRYVRITLDGCHMVAKPAEAQTFLAEAKDGGDESAYTTSDVYLSEREAEDLPEFDGF